MNSPAEKVFKAGSLVYTRTGLIVLFSCLIWGDFTLVLMDQTLPHLLPLLLKSHAATNGQIVFITATLYMIANAALNPVISYSSDRFRSRWGRRRPFIFVTTPFVVLFLALVPFAPEISRALLSHGVIARLLAHGPAAPLILVFGLLVGGYQVFHMFVATVYYYLVPDTVPLELLGRFSALFRVFGALATIVFNYFIFGLAASHMQAIFVSIALFYGFFIMLMCWRVKEGDYPPPRRESHGHWWSGIRNYVKECFGQIYFCWAFLTYACFRWAVLSSVFSVFFYRDEEGLSLANIGQATAWGSALVFVLAYPFGVLVDRWGCHRSLKLGGALTVAATVLMFFLATKATVVEWILVQAIPVYLVSLSMAKWTVEVYPRDRYGQFASAGALLASLGGIALGPVCAWLMDWTKDYRYFLLWTAFFTLMGVIASAVVHRGWERRGGRENVRAV
jgi:maltose/moltooligosaccharide transporter